MTSGDARFLESRNTLLLFDVDGTLTPSRQAITEPIDDILQKLRIKYTIGLVGGSDLTKISEQTLPPNLQQSKTDPIPICLDRFDYVFSENGLVAYKGYTLLKKTSISEYLGEDKIQRIINFCLKYMSNLVLPVKRGNFVEFRTGMINVCPVGRSCNQKQRDEFSKLDSKLSIRVKFIDALKKEFGPESEDPIELTYSIGGQISIDIFPKGWDKTYCLNLIDGIHQEIHFFGDRTNPGGNDHEIFSDLRTIGHAVNCPMDTLKLLQDF